MTPDARGRAPGLGTGDVKVPAPVQAVRKPSPLAALNQYIRSRTEGDAPRAPWYGSEAPAELRSVRRFRDSWGRIAAEDQVRQASVRRPENPGPLNSHSLVLRSLERMSELSPDYLRHLLAHVDTLLWLEQAQAGLKPTAAAPAKTARAARSRK